MSDEELVAWIDENEKFIEAIPLSVVNSDPKFLHQEIALLVYDQNRRVLLQQRSDNKKNSPGVWTVAAAGHVTYGDTLETSVNKELLEEMGITVPKLSYLFREYVVLARESHYCHWFIGQYAGGQIVIDPTEVKDYKWIAEAEFANFNSKEMVSERTSKMIHLFWENKLQNYKFHEN